MKSGLFFYIHIYYKYLRNYTGAHQESGMTFAIVMPSNPSTIPYILMNRAGNMGTVLLVDDDQGARTTLSIALKMAGFDVDTAPDGTEALRKAAQKAYTWIVSDMRMPDMDGMQLIQRMRLLQPALRAILISAFELPQEMKEVEAFFEKPVDVGALCALMDPPPSSMQVIGVAGSPRKGGNTDLLLDQVLAGASSTGAAVDRIVPTVTLNIIVTADITTDNCILQRYQCARFG